ncbi:MAG: polyketide synthase dehydratase domain-containing protein, partial [Anaerolineae bacterium]|nr:polyketide synthase dehydratase domain-containing protein [Anaerolineae bacterium]
ERATMLTALAALYAQGSEVNWDALYPDGGNIVTLPAYPWQRERYWLDLPARGHAASDKTVGALLERQVYSPTLKETVFETRLSADWPPFLADHRILGTVIASGTTLLELASEAAVASGREVVLADFLIREPLVLPDGEERALQVVIGNDNPASLMIYGLENGEWKQYALGTLVPAGGVLLPDESLDAAQSRCSQPADMDAFYQTAVEHGMDFGPSFRGVEQLWLGEGEAVAQVRLPGADSGAYRFHPAGLDACFHPILVLLGEIGSATYLPVSYEAFRQYRQPGNLVWSYTRLRHQTDDMALTDVYIWDEDGALVAEVRGLRVKAASSVQGRPDWLYEVHWKPTPLPEGRPADVAAWLVFADSQGIGESLADQLSQTGDTVLMATPGDDFAVLSPGHWQMNPANARHYEQVVQAALAVKPDLSNIVHLWSLDAPDALPSAGQTLAGSSAIYT